jgi:hypothetical protein
MRRSFNFGRFGTLLFLVVCFVPLSPVLAESYGDLDCTDFGTRERARFEFEKYSFDRYGLDRDGNGDPCEWNPSPGMWPLAAGGAGLLIGRNLGFRKRKGSDFVVPGAKGLFMKWDHRSNGTKVPEFDETALTMAFFWLGSLAGSCGVARSNVANVNHSSNASFFGCDHRCCNHLLGGVND